MEKLSILDYFNFFKKQTIRFILTFLTKLSPTKLLTKLFLENRYCVHRLLPRSATEKQS